MTPITFAELCQRAGQLASCTLAELRAESPDAENNPAEAKFCERVGASRQEIRATHVETVLEEEFGHLLGEEE